MTPLVLVLVTLLVLALAAEVVHVVRTDGYGHRPPPPDHPDDPGLPSRPYALR